MNLLKIIDMLDLDKVDQEQYLKPALRRNLFKKAGDFSLKTALASVPFALIAMPTLVKAQSSAVTDALSLALKLEYLEADFYTQGVAAMTGGKLPTTNKAVFEQILKHENSHVQFLKTALAASAPVKPTFDFTVGGTLDPFNKYDDFLALSQAFEDTGVRAYKGQAGNLVSDKATLTAALQIHSVEARHASEVRRIRGEKGWIKGSSSTLPTALQVVYGAGTGADYPSEANVTQGGVDLQTAFAGVASVDSITEAFDEALDTDTVVTIFKTFCTKDC